MLLASEDAFGEDRGEPLVGLEDSQDAALAALTERAAEYAENSLSAATRAAYEGHWKRYAHWCKGLGQDAMPIQMDMVVRYFTSLADSGKSVSTIMQAVAAIAYRQRSHGAVWRADHPILQAVVHGIRRKLGVRPKQKAALEEAQLRQIIAQCAGDEPLAIRDRAILLVGWLGAFRRSELVAMRYEHPSWTTDGLAVDVPRSKTDQEGAGMRKALPYAENPEMCPVRAVDFWLSCSGIIGGPIWRPLGRDQRERKGMEETCLSSQAIAKIVKSRARQAGLDPAGLSGHSLRSGFVTAAARHDKPLDAIMRQTGHRSAETVMGYIREAHLFSRSAAKGIL